MDGQAHKMAATCTGHEGQGVHICHICGWPFPNQHPSAKQRRAHKKVCGTIDGYNHHLAVSHDGYASHDYEHTPAPMFVKKTAAEFCSSGGVGEKSNKSEDDVFSDAVTEFSDSGISSRSEERFKSVRGLDKSMQRNLEADLYGCESPNVDATADTTDHVNDPIRSEEMSNHGTLVNTNNQSATVKPIADTSTERTSFGLITNLQTDLVESEILRDVAVDNTSEYCNGGSLQGQVKDKSAYITLESEEGRISADESKEVSCDKFVSGVVKHETVTLQNLDASARVESFAHSTKISVECMQTSVFSTERSDEAKPMVSSIDIEVKRKTSLARGLIAGNFDGSEGDKCNMEESDGTFSFAFACADDDQSTRAFEKDVNHSEGKSSCNLFGTRNGKGEGSSAEVQVMPLNATDIPSSCEAASDAEDLHKSSKNESSSPEFRDNNGFDKPLKRLDTVNVTNAQQPVVSADLNHDRVYSLVSTLEDPPNNNHVTSNIVGDVAGIMNELKDNIEVVASELLNNKSANDENTYIKSESAASGASEKYFPGIVSSVELTSRGDMVTSMKCSVVRSPLDVRKTSLETCAANNVDDDDDTIGLNSKPLQDKVDDKLSSHKVGHAAMELSANNNANSRSDSPEGNCGSILDTLKTDSQKLKPTIEDAHLDKSITLEPPTFMTLVQSGGEGNHQVTAVSDIKSTHNNHQQPKSDALEAGWFLSMTNVLNEYEGRKNNKEITAKVTNWSPAKHHGPLKNLLSEVESPNTIQVKGVTDEYKDDGAALTSDVVGPKDHDNKNKHFEQWDSPARYPIEITKEKKKKKKKKKATSYWVPFVCCCSVRRDL